MSNFTDQTDKRKHIDSSTDHQTY